MTIIYIPRTVETVEEVEALPIGAIITDPDIMPVEIWNSVGQRCYGDPDQGLEPDDLTGLTALIPTDVDVYESERMSPGRWGVTDLYDTRPFTLYYLDQEN